MRIFLVDILKFDGFFDAKFHILKPRWLPTKRRLLTAHTVNRSLRIAMVDGWGDRPAIAS